MKVTRVVHTYEIDESCSVCKSGFMRPTGVALLSNPPLYPHKCINAKCGRTENYPVRYPYIEHRAEEGW